MAKARIGAVLEWNLKKPVKEVSKNRVGARLRGCAFVMCVFVFFLFKVLFCRNCANSHVLDVFTRRVFLGRWLKCCKGCTEPSFLEVSLQFRTVLTT